MYYTTTVEQSYGPEQHNLKGGLPDEQSWRTMQSRPRSDNSESEYRVIKQPVVMSKLKMAPLNVHPFTGDIRKFSQFRDEFNSLIRPLCAPKQIALALRNYLSNEVRAGVESIGNDFGQLWKRLELKWLVDAILQDIKAMQSDAKPCSGTPKCGQVNDIGWAECFAEAKSTLTDFMFPP